MSVTADEIKTLISSEIESLKKGFSVFTKSEDMQKEVGEITKRIEELNIKGLSDQLSDLQKAAEAQGKLIDEINNKQTHKADSFLDALKKNEGQLKKMFASSDAGSLNMVTTRKAISGAQVTDDTVSFREQGITQIQRGQEWIRDKFNTVTLGRNSHNTVTWVEQASITNNAEMVAEVSTPANQSGITWAEKTLSSKRVKDFIKVSKDALNDFDFLNGEIRTLIEKNMRLIENTQLLSGNGIGLNIKGILEYAPAFVTAGISIEKAQMIDLLTKCKTQIRKSSMDAFMPNNTILAPDDVDVMRLLKNAEGDYLNPMWALGANPAVAGVPIYENTLITPNTLLMGDFNYGTVYLWDALQIEIGYVGTDFTDGYVTIVAYQRENLRVKDNEVNAFLKVADIATTIAAITKAGA